MEFWIIMFAFVAMGGACSLKGTWWDKGKKGRKESIVNSICFKIK